LPALLAAATILVPLGATTPIGAATGNGVTALAITGFQEVGDPNAKIRSSATTLTTVGVDGVDLSADGRRVGTPDAGARRALVVTHAEHLSAEFLVGNFGRHDFDERRAYRLLSSPTAISSVVATLVGAESSQGWDGISVDLEALRARDRAGLVDFLAALRAAMPSGGSLSVCISNAVTAARFRNGGYDLGGIAAHVDRVILMAYDEHGPWENTPGPVGGLAWQKRGLATVARFVPRSSIDLGQAGYGYAWRRHRRYQLSDAAARRLVHREHGRSRYDRAAGEWVAHLPDGSTLWWADARSYRRRVTLAGRQHLHGLAVWSLGLSDPLK
jgi:spore germination protein YaaH